MLILIDCVIIRRALFANRHDESSFSEWRLTDDSVFDHSPTLSIKTPPERGEDTSRIILDKMCRETPPKQFSWKPLATQVTNYPIRRIGHRHHHHHLFWSRKIHEKASSLNLRCIASIGAVGKKQRSH